MSTSRRASVSSHRTTGRTLSLKDLPESEQKKVSDLIDKVASLELDLQESNDRIVAADLKYAEDAKNASIRLDETEKMNNANVQRLTEVISALENQRVNAFELLQNYQKRIEQMAITLRKYERDEIGGEKKKALLTRVKTYEDLVESQKLSVQMLEKEKTSILETHQSEMMIIQKIGEEKDADIENKRNLLDNAQKRCTAIETACARLTKQITEMHRKDSVKTAEIEALKKLLADKLTIPAIVAHQRAERKAAKDSGENGHSQHSPKNNKSYRKKKVSPSPSPTKRNNDSFLESNGAAVNDIIATHHVMRTSLSEMEAKNKDYSIKTNTKVPKSPSGWDEAIEAIGIMGKSSKNDKNVKSKFKAGHLSPKRRIEQARIRDSHPELLCEDSEHRGSKDKDSNVHENHTQYEEAHRRRIQTEEQNNHHWHDFHKPGEPHHLKATVASESSAVPLAQKEKVHARIEAEENERIYRHSFSQSPGASARSKASRARSETRKTTTSATIKRESSTRSASKRYTNVDTSTDLSTMSAPSSRQKSKLRSRTVGTNTSAVKARKSLMEEKPTIASQASRSDNVRKEASLRREQELKEERKHQVLANQRRLARARNAALRKWDDVDIMKSLDKFPENRSKDRSISRTRKKAVARDFPKSKEDSRNSLKKSSRPSLDVDIGKNRDYDDALLFDVIASIEA